MAANPRRILGVASALLLAATVAQAQGKEREKEHGKGKDKEGKELRAEGREERDRGEDANVRRRDDNTVVWREGRGRHDGRDRNDGRDVVGIDGRRIPPGLAKKPGGMPPGQYKKRYQTSDGANVLRDILVGRGYTVVRTDNAGQSQYVYYRLRDGSVQRAIVSPGTDRLGFTNVPAALLREVLARLY